MEITESPLKNCFILIPRIIEDDRGRFVKPWHIDELKKIDLYFDIREEYYSVSKRDVIRGMHFQTPPRATKKLVTCLSGTVLDVVIDLRRESPTFKKHFAIELSSVTGNMLYIPEGFAHGFCVLSDEAIMLYMASEMYSAPNDTGIHWNSAGIYWPASKPVVSEKDNNLVYLEKYESPF